MMCLAITDISYADTEEFPALELYLKKEMGKK